MLPRFTFPGLRPAIPRGFLARASAVAAGPVSIAGTLPDAIIGQPYDVSLVVSPPGSAITLAPDVTAALAARGISHDGFGRFTAASVT